MYFVVTGAGEVGYHVARTLREEGHEVAIIEDDPVSLRRIESLDALIVEGNGASLDTLRQVEIERADHFIGVTGHDEVNMLGAAIAHQYGAHTVARVNNPQYLSQPATKAYEKIGIDWAICPELVAAEKIANTVMTPTLLNVDVFAENRVHVGELRVDVGSPAVGRRIRDLDLPRGVNLLAVHKGGDTIIAHGDVAIGAGDRVLVAMFRPETLLELEGVLGRPQYTPAGRDVRNVMIAGATRVGMHLARILERTKNVVLIDEDEARCKEATESLDKTLIINGNATDRRILREEDVDTVDTFIGTHGVEEYNILSCLLAKSMGVPKTVAVINQPELRDLVESINIDLAVNPKQATVGTVLRYARKGADLRDVVVTREGDAQILELKVHDDSKLAGRSLKKAHLPRESMCAAIVRGNEVLLPRGTDVFLPGDRVVIYSRPEDVPIIERLF